MTMNFDSIGAFLAHAATMQADVELAKEAAIEKACQMVQKEAKHVIGTYDYGWPQLAELTQEDRVRKGFAANEPLLRTGSLRESIEYSAPHHEGNAVVGFVGTNHPIAPYQEFGTSKIPPRSFLRGAAMRKEDEIHKMTGRLMFAALIHGGPHYRELREFMHLAHKTYKKFEEILDVDESDRKK